MTPLERALARDVADPGKLAELRLALARTLGRPSRPSAREHPVP